MSRLKQGAVAPSFASTDWKGRQVDLATRNGRSTLLCFFRYASCPLCNLRVQELIRSHERFRERNTEILAVFQSPAERIAHYVGRQEPPFPLIPDPDLQLYRLYGVETSWIAFLRAMTLGIGKAGRAAIGHRFLPGTVENELHRVPADFLIDPDGRLSIAFYGKDIGDHVPLDKVFDMLDTRQSS